MSGQRYYWLKLNKDFFKSKRIKKLRKLAGGDTFTIIYLKMQLLSTPTEGVLTYTGLEETIAEEIALDIDEDPENVKITLSYLLKTGLCESLSENELFLPFVADSVGSEGSSAKRVRDFRNRQKALQCNTSVTQVKPIVNGEIDIEIEKDINILSSKEDPKDDLLKQVVDYLNEKTGKNFRASSKSTQRHILGRIKEGYTLEDFKAVIDIKVSQWANDPKMSLYLRPETLFAGHFEGYLNEAPKKKEVKAPEVEKIDLNWQRQFYDSEEEWQKQVKEWEEQGLV